MKKMVVVLVGLAFLGCSAQPTDAVKDEDTVKRLSASTSVAGSYSGFFSGSGGNHYGDNGFSWPVEFSFTDSSYSWDNGIEDPFLREWGSGPYRVEGDSIHFRDAVIRLWHRGYVILNGNYRYSFDGDILTFFRVFNDSVYQAVVLEKQAEM